MTNKPNLKPCPFCGGEATLTEGEQYDELGCFNLECLDAVVVRGSRDKIVKLWSRRASQPLPPPPEEE